MSYEEKLVELIAEKFDINKDDIIDARTDTWMGGYCETCEYEAGGIIFTTPKNVKINDWRLDKQEYYQNYNVYRYETSFDTLMSELIG